MLKDVETWFRPPSSPQDSVERLLNFGHLCTVICPICSMSHCQILRRLEHVSNISLVRCLGFVLRHVLPSAICCNVSLCHGLYDLPLAATVIHCGEGNECKSGLQNFIPCHMMDMYSNVFKFIQMYSVYFCILASSKNQTCPRHPFMLQRFNLLTSSVRS